MFGILEGLVLVVPLGMVDPPYAETEDAKLVVDADDGGLIEEARGLRPLEGVCDLGGCVPRTVPSRLNGTADLMVLDRLLGVLDRAGAGALTGVFDLAGAALADALARSSK